MIETICAIRTRYSGIKKNRLEKIEKVWNKTFRINFQKFREKLRFISKQNRSFMNPQFKKEMFYPSLNLETFIKSNGFLIFPTDDDDWFHKETIAIISDLDMQSKEFVRWNYAELMLGKVKKLRVLEEWGPYYKYQTNNYAFITPNKKDFLNSHYPDISGLFPKEKILDMNLSIHNKTPASLSHPRKFFSPEELKFQINLYLKNSESLYLPEFQKEIDMLLDLLRKTNYIFL